LEGIDPFVKAVIFNPDGTVRFYLKPPVLISHKYKEYEKRVGAEEAIDSVRFIQPALENIHNKGIVLTMWIGFDDDWFESRNLNTKTGEFGECYGVSRL